MVLPQDSVVKLIRPPSNSYYAVTSIEIRQIESSWVDKIDAEEPSQRLPYSF
jgi:hypothetical protein